MSDVWLIAGFVVLVLTAAFFAMAETALTRMSRIRAISLEEEGRRNAGRLVRLVEHPERFLTPILLLVLACHLVAATIVGVLVERLSGIAGVAAAIVLEIVVIFVVAESMPKTWAVQHPDRAALITAPVVSWVSRFPPLRWFSAFLIGLTNVILPGKGLKKGPFVSEEELLAMADVAAEEDVIEHEERTLIRSIIEFGDTVVREVMVPRPDMITVDSDFRVMDAMEVVLMNGYSRVPVTGTGIDDVLGIVYAKDLMRAEREGKGEEPVTMLMRPARFVPETKRVAELLREMQSEKFHMAIVIDEYGGTAGLVTLEDLIEELVGEIVDEFDVEDPLMEPMPGGDVRVDGRMPIDELNEFLDADLPEGDWDTVGGLLFNLLGHVPTEGECVDVDGYRLRAERIQGRRISRIRISRVEPAPAES